MENNENNGKYDDYPFPAGRMEWNGFALVLIETIINMLLMRGSNRNAIIIPGIIIGSCGFIILIIAMIICSLPFNGCLSSDVNGIHVGNACIPPIPFPL